MLDEVRKRHEGRTHRTSAADAALLFNFFSGLRERSLLDDALGSCSCHLAPVGVGHLAEAALIVGSTVDE